MTKLVTWRPGDTPYPGYTFEDGAGNSIVDANIVQFLVEFKDDQDAVLARFCKTPVEGHTLAVKTSEVVDAGGDPVDVYRFPIDHTMTASWPSQGKVRMTVKVRTISAVFAAGGYRKVFDEYVAVLQPGNTTDL